VFKNEPIAPAPMFGDTTKVSTFFNASEPHPRFAHQLVYDSTSKVNPISCVTALLIFLAITICWGPADSYFALTLLLKLGKSLVFLMQAETTKL